MRATPRISSSINPPRGPTERFSDFVQDVDFCLFSSLSLPCALVSEYPWFVAVVSPPPIPFVAVDTGPSVGPYVTMPLSLALYHVGV